MLFFFTCSAKTTFRKQHTGGPASKSHFSHISLEKHLSPRLIMNKNQKQIDILILIYSDFTLIFFLYLFFLTEERMNVRRVQERRGKEDQPHHYPHSYNLISISFFICLSLFLCICHLLLICWEMVDFAY